MLQVDVEIGCVRVVFIRENDEDLVAFPGGGGFA